MNNSHQENAGRGSQNKRSEPPGYQQGSECYDQEGAEVLAEKRIRPVIYRSTGQERSDPLPNERRRLDPSQRDLIYNSFTASYNNERSTEKEDSPPRLSEHYRQRFREAENSPPRTRRVKFSEQLEIDTKQIPQRPTTPTIPILRTRDRARKDTPPVHGSKKNTPDARDPTPRSSEKPPRANPSRSSNPPRSSEKPPRANQVRQPLSSDPPMDRSKELLFSPAAKPRKDILSRLEQVERANRELEARENAEQVERANRELEARENVESQNKRSIGPSTTPPSRQLQHPTSPDSWDVGHLFSKGNGGLTPRGKQGGNSTPWRTDSDLESRDSTLSSHPIFPALREQPLRAYSPRTDHWDAPDLYPDSWMHDPESPSDASSESQSEYLINKYTKNSRSSIQDLSRKRAHPSSTNRTEGGDGAAFSKVPTTPTGGASQGIRYEPVVDVGDGARSKRQNKQKGYAQLDDEEEGEHGTELILVPRIPERIDVHNTADFSDGYETPRAKRKGLSAILRRTAVGSSSQVPFQQLQVVAVSYDDDLKKSTDETDDSDSEKLCNAKASNWNNVDQESKVIEHDNPYLTPSHGVRARKKHSLASMLVLLVAFCLTVGLPIYFKMAKDTGANKFQRAEKIECENSSTENSAFSERYITIRKYLIIANAGDIATIDDPGTPQRKSLCWISDFDERQLSLSKGNIQALVQRYTLGVIYYALISEETDDPGSLRNTDFLSSSDECDWGVIMCSAPDTVTALLLADKFLSGSLPAEVGNLMHLSFLELSLNKLTGSIPTSFQKLTILEYFSVAFNTFTGPLPSELGAMSKLEFVNMRSSNINGTIPHELGRLTLLETLLLEGNWLSGTIPSSLGNLYKAQQMSFRKNYLSGRVANDLCELREESLTDLNVDSWIECDCCTR